jgi:selenocysteine-specific elongation factor
MKKQDITIGTAGHIDHGKSELIFRLTGAHPDRLKEEKERGMTIDLGYSAYVTTQGDTIGIIDVPGHERFIRNMVAGAASINHALLVVAADDGVMPQTREHMNIMIHLGIRSGLVALTKVDLVDEETVTFAIEDVRDLVRGTFLEGAPILPVSSLSGQGLDQFRNALDLSIERIEPANRSGAFRMPIQRAFTVKGFGTVVTGVPATGSIWLGDQVEILPHGVRGRVRNIQVCNETRPEGAAGNRTALNISNVDYRSLRRGDEVVVPGSFNTTTLFEGEFLFSRDAGFTLKNGATVRVHTGTSETLARIILLDSPHVQPGDSALVQLRLVDPILVVPGDPFVVRLHSPMITLGGGKVLGLTQIKLKRFKDRILTRITAKRDSLGDLRAQLLLEAEARPEPFFSSGDAARALNTPLLPVREALQSLAESGSLIEIRQDQFVHKKAFTDISSRIVAFISRYHEQNPLVPFVDTKQIRDLAGTDSRSLPPLLTAMERLGLLETSKGGLVRRRGFMPVITECHEKIMKEMEKQTLTFAAGPPEREDFISNRLKERSGPSRLEIESLLQIMLNRRSLIRVGAYLFHPRVVDEIAEALVEVIREHGEVHFASLRERVKTTRRWIIPLLDHFDETGLTCRVDGKRKLKNG